MSGPGKRTSKATLEALVRQAEADEAVRETLAMSDDAVERELAAAGFDLETERRTAAAIAADFRAAASGASTKRAARTWPRRARWLPLLAAATLALMGLLLAWIARTRPRSPFD